MKNKNINLSECSDDEMVDIISKTVLGKPDEPASMMMAQVAMHDSQHSDLLKTRLSQYIAMVRMMQLWYHAAHHITRGVGFAGDHVTIFGSFYKQMEEEFDGAVEKAIGLTNDEELGCPVCVTSMSAKVMTKYPSPAKCTSLSIASIALQMENDYQALVKAIFDELESAGCLTLGLDDFLMANANEHEGNIYKLQQRVKSEIED